MGSDTCNLTYKDIDEMSAQQCFAYNWAYSIIMSDKQKDKMFNVILEKGSSVIQYRHAIYNVQDKYKKLLLLDKVIASNDGMSIALFMSCNLHIDYINNTNITYKIDEELLEKAVQQIVLVGNGEECMIFLKYTKELSEQQKNSIMDKILLIGEHKDLIALCSYLRIHFDTVALM